MSQSHVDLPCECAGWSLADFCAASDTVVPFMRSLLASLASDGVKDYRVKVRPCSGDPQFSICIAARQKDHKTGPRAFDQCLSCTPESARIAEENYHGGESGRGPPGGLPPHLAALTAASCEWRVGPGTAFVGLDAALVRIWLDAQARPLMIVTPRR
jgi:hypothetical protein